ncbi:MAG: hypothetical protein IJT35_04395 [Paludibacteraceae bacterium]|nr:hypothetical protein [Paludibacteraceae bacterium]
MAIDVIVLRNSTRIDAKIIEVTDTEIKYKKANNLDGPLFTQKVENISAIIYENGDVTSYAETAQMQTPQQTVAQSPAKKQTNADSTGKSAGIKFNPQPSDDYWFGLTVGYMSKQQKATYNGKTEKGSFIIGQEGKVTPGILLGFTMNPTFKYGLGLRSGIFIEYGMETYKVYGDYYTEYKYFAQDLTLSVPLQLSYRYEIIPKLSIMLYTGPVFDFGAYKSVKTGSETTKNLYSYKIGGEDYDEEKGYSGFNALWGIGGAIQWDRLRLDIGGNFGMINKYEHDTYDVKWNQPIYTTLTCFF